MELNKGGETKKSKRKKGVEGPSTKAAEQDEELVSPPIPQPMSRRDAKTKRRDSSGEKKTKKRKKKGEEARSDEERAGNQQESPGPSKTNETAEQAVEDDTVKETGEKKTRKRKKKVEIRVEGDESAEAQKKTSEQEAEERDDEQEQEATEPAGKKKNKEPRPRPPFSKGEEVMLKKAAALRKGIEACFDKLTAEEAELQLSNPLEVTRLVVPSVIASAYGPPAEFLFIGRSQFQKLLKFARILPFQLDDQRPVKLGGYSGRGKSWLMAALACYLQHYHEQPVVYIQASALVTDQISHVVNALLLAYARDPEKQRKILRRAREGDKRVLDFCRVNKPLFLMDEMNALDVDEAKMPTSKEAARNYVMVLSPRALICASENSTTYRGDDGTTVMMLNEPFTLVELHTFLESRGKAKEDVDELVQHTGLVPRILAFYLSDSASDKDARLRLLEEFVSNLNTDDKISAARSILLGQVEYLSQLYRFRTDRFEPSAIFYERMIGGGSSRVVEVLPYLEPLLRAALDLKRASIHLKTAKQCLAENIMRLKSLLEEDSSLGIQPAAALNGMLAERVARECILLHQQFQRSTFTRLIIDDCKPGNPIAGLLNADSEQLKNGICFIPQHEYAPSYAADLHVVRMSDDEQEISVEAIQVIVSNWSEKRKKNSHSKWFEDAPVMWKRGRVKVKLSFTYVLPNALQGSVDAKNHKKVKKIKFSEVHEDLAFIDHLKAPEMVLTTCSGKNNSDCKRTAYCSPGEKI